MVIEEFPPGLPPRPFVPSAVAPVPAPEPPAPITTDKVMPGLQKTISKEKSSMKYLPPAPPLPPQLLVPLAYLAPPPPEPPAPTKSTYILLAKDGITKVPLASNSWSLTSGLSFSRLGKLKKPPFMNHLNATIKQYPSPPLPPLPAVKPFLEAPPPPPPPPRQPSSPFAPLVLVPAPPPTPPNPLL